MGSFKDVVGHKDIIKYIQNAVTADKVSHAYILNGQRGAGKKMLARLFAMTLLCEKRGPEPCGECHSCIQAESGNHPDIIRVVHEKPGSISVDDIREQVNQTVAIKPYQGPYKIYIIPEADLMTIQAQNALLKTIEEPPEYVVILLLTENADLLLPTITSRCVMLKLRNIKDTLIKKYLMEKLEVPDYKADICTAFAQGNMGQVAHDPVCHFDVRGLQGVVPDLVALLEVREDIMFIPVEDVHDIALGERGLLGDLLRGVVRRECPVVIRRGLVNFLPGFLPGDEVLSGNKSLGHTKSFLRV